MIPTHLPNQRLGTIRRVAPGLWPAGESLLQTAIRYTIYKYSPYAENCGATPDTDLNDEGLIILFWSRCGEINIIEIKRRQRSFGDR